MEFPKKGPELKNSCLKYTGKTMCEDSLFSYRVQVSLCLKKMCYENIMNLALHLYYIPAATNRMQMAQ